METTTALTDQELARAAGALAHPARLAILRTLSGKECICGELVEVLPLAQSTVSQHLSVLKKAGLISGVVDGPRCCYSINREGMRRLQLTLDLLMGQLEGAPSCPC